MSSSQTGILVVNLGTPQAPTAPAVRRYLAEFLSDSRVVEIPRLVWLPLLYGLILPLRCAKVAKKYAGIWDAQGSPLAVNTAAIGQALQAQLQVPLQVAYRYGAPSLDQGLDALEAAGCRRIVVLPLYPQFSATTTATIFDRIAERYRARRAMPALDFIADYHDSPGYIDALADSVQQHWQQHGRGERLLMSFHGLPQRNVDQGDPYQSQCEITAQKLAQRLQLGAKDWALAYQSRFGKQVWLQPYSEPLLCQWAADGLRRVDVICPGFAADCLETLEEIRIEANQAFVDAGGEQLNYIAALNAAPSHTEALAALIRPRL